MTKTILFKTVRLILILAAALVIVTPVLAQGTVPGGGQNTSGNTGSGTLNAGTGSVSFDAGECAGSCSVTPALDPLARQTPPPGGGTVLSGLNLRVTNPPGTFGVPLLTISFQRPPGQIVFGANGEVTNPVIMNFDTSLVPPRWVALPTFVDPVTGLLYTNARLVGNFGLVRQ